jgi:hypothetical protein
MIATYIDHVLDPLFQSFQIPVRGKTFFSFSENVQTGAVPHPALYLFDTDVLSKG